MSSAIGKTCSPVVQDVNSDDSKIQPSSCFLTLASLLTKHSATDSSMWGWPFSTTAAYRMGCKVGPGFVTACRAGAEGVVAGTGMAVKISTLRSEASAGTVTVAVTTVVLFISPLDSPRAIKAPFSEHDVPQLRAVSSL